MRRITSRRAGAGLAAGALALGGLTVGLAAAPAAADARPATYRLTGDATPPGSKFEGIGVDERSGRFYVSETTGGEIHRGDVRVAATREWLAGDGADGRFTARGITVDDAGRIYIAGGPNGIDNPTAPDLWVYSRSGRLLAALRVGVSNAFLNDVAIGPDGAAYFTNSNAPQIFRVARSGGAWRVQTWLDATGTIPTAPGFNLGGIVATPDGAALIVAQGNAGRLWRVDLGTRSVTGVDTGGVALGGADGLVLKGRTLWVVRNFPRVLTTLQLSGDWSSTTLVAERGTDPTRVFTTAKLARGRLLAVDSKFEENPATPPYEVVSLSPR